MTFGSVTLASQLRAGPGVGKWPRSGTSTGILKPLVGGARSQGLQQLAREEQPQGWTAGSCLCSDWNCPTPWTEPRVLALVWVEAGSTGPVLVQPTPCPSLACQARPAQYSCSSVLTLPWTAQGPLARGNSRDLCHLLFVWGPVITQSPTHVQSGWTDNK